MAAVYANNAVSSLLTSITAGQTTLTVQASDAAEFPTPTGGNWFPVTLIEGTNLEIVWCTGRAGAVLTVTRAQEGTIARAFTTAAKVSHRLTAAALTQLVPEAASDGLQYARRNAAWSQVIIPASEPPIAAGTAAQYWRGDKIWAPLDKVAVGLANVDNVSDANKPVSSATQTALNAKEDKANKGASNGYAALDGSGKVPAGQLPAYVDDVLEYANLTAFPTTGTAGIIYVALDTNKTYRWSGSAYVEISPSPGSTDAVPEGSINLYYTNARASAAAPVQSVNSRTGAVVINKTDVGLSNVDNTSDALKPVSTAGAAADALRVLKTGDTMTGTLTLPAGTTSLPSLMFGTATNTGLRGGPANVIASINAIDRFNISDTIIVSTLPITLPADPISALQAATKQYADLKAPLISPSFSGDPQVPTATFPDNDLTIANTAYVTTGLATKLSDAASDGKTYGRKNGTWAEFTGGIAQAAISDTPPVAPPAGAMWWESDTGNSYIYYSDANSSQWVQLNVFGAGSNPASYLTITSPPPVGFSFAGASTDMWFGIKSGPIFAVTNDPYGAGTNLLSVDKATGNLTASGTIATAGQVSAGSLVTSGTVTVGGVMTATSPAFAGVPTVPTAAQGTNTAQAASTAFVLANGVPSGTVVMFAGPTIPTGWLKCNGAAISRTTYATLYAAIGGYYGAGDGSTTFNLPDLRGEFWRGVDDGRGVDASRGLGTFQDQGIAAHTHTATSWGTGGVTANHYHNVAGATAGRNAGHTHTFADSSSATGNASANHAHTVPGRIATGTAGVGFAQGSGVTYTDNPASGAGGAAHTHTVAVSGTTSGESVDHLHGVNINSGNISSDHGHWVSGTTDYNASYTTDTRPRNVAMFAIIKY